MKIFSLPQLGSLTVEAIICDAQMPVCVCFCNLLNSFEDVQIVQSFFSNGKKIK